VCCSVGFCSRASERRLVCDGSAAAVNVLPDVNVGARSRLPLARGRDACARTVAALAPAALVPAALAILEEKAAVGLDLRRSCGGSRGKRLHGHLKRTCELVSVLRRRW